MDRPGSLVAPYRPGPDGQLRPYLLLTLIGLKPDQEVEISGLVDTDDLTRILIEKAVEDETIRTSVTADFSSLVGFIKFR